MDELLMTQDPDRFAAQLRPGDVLLVDSTGFVAGPPQWGDRAPYNHACLVLDDTYFVEANREPPPLCADHQVGRLATQRAISSGCLHLRLRQHGICTTTLMRHEALRGSASAEPVLAAARAMMGRASRFSVLDLALIGQERFLINFPDELGRRDHQLFWRFLVAMSRRAIDQVGDGTRSISCAEFVHRCFSDSGDPAFALQRTKVPSLDDFPSIAGSDAADELEALWARLAAREASVAGSGEGDPGDTPSGLANRLADADRCSPGDFARSGDFTRVAVLVHPIDRHVGPQPESPAHASEHR